MLVSGKSQRLDHPSPMPSLQFLMAHRLTSDLLADKVCQLLDFFQNLRLRKSQANTLLYQLSRDWEREFDSLCTLLAHSLVVHADETRWSLNSVWAFLSEKARVVLFGVHKDAGTLQTILDPESFAGILISDDAAVYAHFTRSQKCWAHLLRKGSCQFCA